MSKIIENDIEFLTIEELEKLGWEYLPGLSIAPGAEKTERENHLNK